MWTTAIQQPDVAIIGAGIAGLMCARALTQGGLRVELFDKGRKAGGRICTRRRAIARFDHGAQYFTIRSERFARTAQELAARGIIAPWQAHFGRARSGGQPATHRPVTRWVGTPTMSALAKALAEPLTVHQGERVERMERRDGRWQLQRADGSVLGRFPRVVVALPAPQAAQLLQGTALHREVRRVRMAPCWALMVSFASPLQQLSFDAIRWDDEPIAWIARESSKPGRLSGNRWVVHASPWLSREHLEASPKTMAKKLLAELQRLVGPLPMVVSAQAHRWRYALVERPVDADMLYDAGEAIGACGDWCIGGRIEAAALSGMAMADQLLDNRRMRSAS